MQQGPIKDDDGTGFGKKRRRRCSICRHVRCRCAGLPATHAHRFPFYSCGIIGGRRKTNESVRKESKLWCGSLLSVIRCGWGNGGTPLLLLLLASLVSLWVVHVPQLLCLDLLVLTVLHVRKEAARDGSMGGL